MFQQGLFGEVMEELRAPAQPVPMILDFETHPVRMILIKGTPWWALPDVARALGYTHTPHAARLLKDKHKGVHQMDTLGGRQATVIINEAGLYCLMTNSERPEADRFRDWLYEEVLPSIRKTGSYTLPQKSRVEKLAKRLKSDVPTAERRAEVIDRNKKSGYRLSDEGSPRRGFVAWYDGLNQAQFNGHTAADLRKRLGLKKRQTPLDHMGEIPLSQRSHAICLAERRIQEAEGVTGKPLDIEAQLLIVQEVTRHVVASSFDCLGPDHEFGLRDDRKRGKVLDVVCRQLPAA